LRKVWQRRRFFLLLLFCEVKTTKASIVLDVRQAVDFGTKNLNPSRKVQFEDPGDGSMLPPVTDWTRPQPRQGRDSLRSELDSCTSTQIRSLHVKDDWRLRLPAADFLYKVHKGFNRQEAICTWWKAYISRLRSQFSGFCLAGQSFQFLECISEMQKGCGLRGLFLDYWVSTFLINMYSFWLTSCYVQTLTPDSVNIL
jgi:hypothetical protein